MAVNIVASLYNSTICRICAVDNAEGTYIYDAENNLKSIINTYLPLKIDDDNKFPRTVCPGCHIQLASTVQFFDLIVEGQARLRQLWADEKTFEKNLEREKQRLADTLKAGSRISVVQEGESSEDGILIKFVPEEPFFGEEHELTLRVQGLNEPKRKRGRPRKVKSLKETAAEEDINETQELLEEKEEILEEDDRTRRLRRRRKLPQRFSEAVAGKELERILREEGAIEAEESEETNDVEKTAPMVVELPTEAKQENDELGEIIGHITYADGEVAEPIIAPPPIIRRKKIQKFICDFCGQSYKDRTRWIRHRVTHKGLRFKCNEDGCEELFTSRSKLRQHQQEKEHKLMTIVSRTEKPCAEQRFICGLCEVPFNTTLELTTHIATEHALDKEAFEYILPETAESEQIDKETGVWIENDSEPTEDESLVKSDEPKGKHQCDECDRSFNHTSSLIYHKESIHNDGRRFVCSKCDKAFNHKQLLHRHQMVHSDIRPYECDQCGMGFKTKSNLVNHRVVHTGEKKFTCGMCGQRFAHKTSLNLHISWHKGIRPFQCPFCLKRFTQNGNLREHMRIHKGEKPFKCESCNKQFTTSSQHKLHVRRHTGDRPWKCKYCPKMFSHKDTWKTHERRHTGEKPFNCDVCNKSFAEHWSLKKHKRLHTGEKPYKCDMCAKEFADCSNLTKHKRVHAPHAPSAKNQMMSAMKHDILKETASVENLHDVIFVAFQEDEGQSVQAVEFPKNISEIDDIQEATAEGQTMAFVDEEGNPVQLSIPGGRTVDIISLDMETNIVQVRTSEGWNMFIQLPPNRELVEEEVLEQIRQTVAQAKPQAILESAENMREDDAGPETEATFSSPQDEEKMLEMDLLNVKPNVSSQQQGIHREQTNEFHMGLTKPMELVGDFAIEALNKDLLTTD